MFDQLRERLEATFKRLRGRGRLREEDVAAALREVRVALLEADVALAVVKAFIERVRARAVGREVLEAISPGQAVIKIVHDELVELLGPGAELDLAARPPAVVLVAGLQGCGKTTSAAKLARWLAQAGRRVGVASTDVHRPAAIDQLARLAAEADAEWLAAKPTDGAVEIAAAALAQAKRRLLDTVVLDTAGRLHIDEAMMSELKAVHAAVRPVETLFVADATTGQDAVNSARAFDAALPLTGVILTKTDGDARGGAALSIRHVTGKPIKFLGTGERLDALEVFDPQRLAGRILGMGDIVSVVEEAERRLDRRKAEALATKIRGRVGFDLTDLRDQLAQLQSLGGLEALAARLPGALGAAMQGAALGERQVKHMIAIIDSMTPEERVRPEIIRASRKRRIARGSGTQVQDVNRLLKQFAQMQKMMKRAKKGGLERMMQMFQGRFPGPLP